MYRLLRPCVCQKFLTFRLSRYFDIVRLSMVKTGPKENRGFERPKFLRNLPKILPRSNYIPEFSTYVKNILSKIDSLRRKSSQTLRVYIGQIHTFQKCIQNCLSTLRGRDKQLFVFWQNNSELCMTGLLTFDGDRQFSKIPVYFW